MSDQDKGIYNKYKVINRETGEEVQGDYFVLKPKDDLAARAALETYANNTTNPKLAVGIRRWLSAVRKPATNEEDNVKTYVAVDFKLGTSLDTIVKALQDEYSKFGKLVYYVFNGVKLESDTVTMDSAYLAVTGMTKEAFDALKDMKLGEHRRRVDNYNE